MKPVRAALLRVLTSTLIALGCLAGVSALLAWTTAGKSAVGAALLGVGVAAIIGLVTQWSLLVGSRLTYSGLLVLLLSSFIGKVLLLVGVVLAVEKSHLNHSAFAFPFVAGVLLSLVVEVVVLARAEVPYTAPVGDRERG